MAALARRNAEAVASVPELTRRTTSMPGTIAAMSSASSTSAAVGTPNDVPLATAAVTAATTSGSA